MTVIGRVLKRTLLTVAAVIGGLVIYFFCEQMFAGYPQYGTGILTIVGLVLVAATAGIIWIIDHRRLDASD